MRTLAKYPKGTLCSIATCPQPVKAKGLCNPHYQRQRLGRDVEARMRPKTYATLQEHLDYNTKLTDHGLIWTGCTVRGYGRVAGGTEGARWAKMAHRLSWELVHGPIPSGLELDHEPECPRNCVTVAHLTPRTKKEHARIGWERGQFEGNGWSQEARALRTKTTNCILCESEYTGDCKSKYCSYPCKTKAGNLKRKERSLGLDPGTLCPTLEFDTFSRKRVYEEDQGICGICGFITDPENWHLDHIIARALGGLHIRSNVQVSHPICNLTKGARML